MRKVPVPKRVRRLNNAAKIGRNTALHGFWLAVAWGPLLAMACSALSMPASAGTALGAHRARSSTLENRIDAFSKALSLDVAQQAQLRNLLLQERETVQRIWSDKSLSPAERAPATLAAGERLGGDIRSILNDEQKKKYNTPKPAASAEPEDRRSVDQWLDAARSR